MANQQESNANRSGEQLKLKMANSARDKLIAGLTQLSTILQCNRSPPADEKQQTCEKIKECIQSLVDLSPIAVISSARDSNWFDQLIFELPKVERTRIVTHLMDFKDAVLSDQLITDETKSSLITENKRIINQLLSLPCKVQDDAIVDAGSAEEDTGERPSKKRRVESVPNEELGRLKAVTTSQGEQIARFEVKMNELKSELKREIKEVDITRAEASFQFELANVRKFFEVVGSERFSDQFWCRGLKWSVKVQVELENNVKHLGCYLFCHNEDWTNWSCKANYELILFTNLPEKRNYVYKYADTFDKTDGCGFSGLTYSELIDRKNGYIKNDTIRLGVQLKAGPVLRFLNSDDFDCSESS